MRTAFARVAGAPGLIALVVAVQLVLAFAVGSSVRAAAAASMGGYALLSEGRLLGSLFELLVEHPGIFGAARQLLAGSAVLSLTLWTVLAAGIITRLEAPRPMADVLAAAGRGLPGVLGVTLWHLIPRLIFLAVCGAVARRAMRADDWGWLGAVFLIAVVGYLACALDLARCHAVLHGARGWHPRTALGGFVEAARRPGVLLPSLLMSFGQWTAVVAVVAVSVAGLGTAWAPWLARILAVVGVVFGLGRIAVAVGAGPPSSRPARDPARRSDDALRDDGLRDDGESPAEEGSVSDSPPFATDPAPPAPTSTTFRPDDR